MKDPKTLSKIFFPDGIKCIFCDGEIDEENRYCICDTCSPEFNVKYCSLCGKAINNLADYCHDCKEGRRYEFDQARAPFVFSGNVRRTVHTLKYGSGRYMARYMAEFMADTFLESEWDADMVTFVPTHEKRLRERGYNQAQLLADCVAEILNLPCASLLTRKVSKLNLAKMSREERLKSISGMISFDSAIDVKQKTVLLVDDVMTTSATADECSRILKAAGVSHVYVLTFATSRVKPFLY